MHNLAKTSAVWPVAELTLTTNPCETAMVSYQVRNCTVTGRAKVQDGIAIEASEGGASRRWRVGACAGGSNSPRLMATAARGSRSRVLSTCPSVTEAASRRSRDGPARAATLAVFPNSCCAPLLPRLPTKCRAGLHQAHSDYGIRQ